MLRTNLAKCKVRSSTNTCSECTVLDVYVMEHALCTVRTVLSRRLYIVHCTAECGYCANVLYIAIQFLDLLVMHFAPCDWLFLREI
jgi:hypothetical protein